MNPVFIVVFVLFLAGYGGLSYYIGLRGWQGLFMFLPFIDEKVYWLILAGFSLMYIVSRLLENKIPFFIYRWLSVLGSWWLGFMFYAFLLILPFDLILSLCQSLGLTPSSLEAVFSGTPYLGLSVFLIILAIVVYGGWNACHPRIKRYQVQIDKSGGAFSSLRIVMVSDLHLGTIVGRERLLRMIKEINALHPDLIFLVGDIVDDEIQPFFREKMGESFRGLKADLGVYAVPGNHEYISKEPEGIIRSLTEAGVKVLKDEVIMIENSFYLVGRNDVSQRRMESRLEKDQRISEAEASLIKEKSLKDILKGLNLDLPMILLDHQPSRIAEAAEAGVDLQLSGHTHAGQLFPLRWVTRLVFEQDYGLLSKGKYHVIVSSGYGTWGPPIRLGNRPEIVEVQIDFRE